MTDGQLLESFIAGKSEAAFEALLRRHGPMVLGVCRRALNNHHDAEDAFQATFLILARKASSVRPREMVGNWLHGVAYRTALKAHATITKRRVRERQVTELPEIQAERQDAWHNLRPLLDQELSRLPETYRLPLVFCDLENKSIKEATRQLGWPQGTLAGRLARARRMLVKRLIRRGAVLSVGSVTAVLSEKTASACLPPALAASTVKAAAALASGPAATTGVISANVAALVEGVLKAVFLTKLKTMSVVLLVLGMVTFGGGLLFRHIAAGQEIKTAPQMDNAQSNQDEFRLEVVPGTQVQRLSVTSKQTPNTQTGPRKSLDEKKLHGEWIGKDDFSLIFGPNNSILRIYAFNQLKGTYSVDWAQKPHHLYLKWGAAGPVRETIMEFTEDGKLRIQIGGSDEDRPKMFTDKTRVLTRKEKPPDGSKQAEAEAAKDLDQASFYRRTGKFGSAHFCYELIRHRYPGTEYAKKATQGLDELKKHRITLPDGSEGWETPDTEPPQPQPAPKLIGITPPQAERLLDQALGGKSDVAQFPIKMLSPTLYVAAKKVTIEKDGRARFEPFRAIIFGKNSEITLVISQRAMITFDKPIGKLAELGSRTIVGTQFDGLTEMRTVRINSEGEPERKIDTDR
ncbi:MAG TPA: sigma-70 family RNA polymerase sigma factor [Gemmataceae bacterium]|nr:sigma-70 family RNA polymerase sigma factor [Gemmataceae bacterium]